MDASAIAVTRVVWKQAHHVIDGRLIGIGRVIVALQKIARVLIPFNQRLHQRRGFRVTADFVGIQHQYPIAAGIRNGTISRGGEINGCEIESNHRSRHGWRRSRRVASVEPVSTTTSSPRNSRTEFRQSVRFRSSFLTIRQMVRDGIANQARSVSMNLWRRSRPRSSSCMEVA